MKLNQINTYNKDMLVKDFLIWQVWFAISKTLEDNNQEQFILKWWSALRKFFIPNYPRFTWDLDYKVKDEKVIDDVFFKEMIENLYIYMNQSISWLYKSIHLNPVITTKNWVIQSSVRFLKTLWNFDYTIWLDFSKIQIWENIPTQNINIIPSKIDEIVWNYQEKSFLIEDINSSIWNKIFACLHRIWSCDKCWSILSRIKDIFDIYYSYNANLISIDLVKSNFMERYYREGENNKRIVRNQLYNISDQKNYFENLLKFLVQFDLSMDSKDIFYKYTRWLDKNYIIPNLKNIYDIFTFICNEISRDL